jgi:glutamine synthetase
MATKHDYSKDDIRSMVKDEDVKFLRLMFTDLLWHDQER